ncbi:hypothetical protein KIN20_034627 [Parelaphostrongylus tenuis]|uniref:Uncharacterized protein n=1 Tax=Parelaphostrongylus tenuis TaxID=148309 RepID=A0AAD5WK69_PARTN|nr:hypothetical protein KIN20_034627 [Parelaphostrongylus tenuis]
MGGRDWGKQQPSASADSNETTVNDSCARENRLETMLRPALPVKTGRPSIQGSEKPLRCDIVKNYRKDYECLLHELNETPQKAIELMVTVLSILNNE